MYLRFEQMCGAPKQLAKSTFYAVDSNRGKREMLSAVASHALSASADRSVLDDILRRVGRSAAQRNKYIHDTWCVAKTQKREVFQLRLARGAGERDMDEVHINDLKDATENINKLAHELHEFGGRIAASIPASLEKLRSQPGLPLVFAAKGHNPGRFPKGHGSSKPKHD